MSRLHRFEYEYMNIKLCSEPQRSFSIRTRAVTLFTPTTYCVHGKFSTTLNATKARERERERERERASERERGINFKYRSME